MKVIILCGGNGTRLEDYSLPKPLNMIHGKPAIWYSLKNIPDEISELDFIVAPHLVKYNFEQIVINLFKNKKCIFHYLPYFTRGPIESAYIGSKSINSEESVVFLDNDVLYNFPQDFFKKKENAFIGYSKDSTGSESYSFVKLNDYNNIVSIKEKMRISDLFCCGVYGFKNIEQFRNISLNILNKEINCELYMSIIFHHFLESNVIIDGIYFPGKILHIGSLKELNSSWLYFEKKSMRVCFDLDNTLVTYPQIPGDYSTVNPIYNMIDLARKMKEEGHTIIIYTARRMETHKNNVGAVIRDIGRVTFDTLDKFDIPYDELIFGKPIADIYIDDRAINPYRNDLKSMGYLKIFDKELPLNKLPTNKYNNIELMNNKIIKSGPSEFLNGEIFYYENLPIESSINCYFPLFIGAKRGATNSELQIEYIKSIPFYTLYKNKLLNNTHIQKLFEFIDLLHNTYSPNINISSSDIYSNYIDKLKRRFAKKEDYPFENAETVQKDILEKMELYLRSNETKISHYIHGDLWFSNILLDFNNNIKVIDMKGIVNDKFTTAGDVMYDYAKLYQSVIGYDACLYEDVIDEEYSHNIRIMFEEQFIKRGINLDNLLTITKSLIIGTLHSHKNINIQNRIWNFYNN